MSEGTLFSGNVSDFLRDNFWRVTFPQVFPQKIVHYIPFQTNEPNLAVDFLWFVVAPCEYDQLLPKECSGWSKVQFYAISSLDKQFNEIFNSLTILSRPFASQINTLEPSCHKQRLKPYNSDSDYAAILKSARISPASVWCKPGNFRFRLEIKWYRWLR